MKTKRCLVPAVGLAMVFSASGFGQSMIGYGHGVARAGAAGAASGTGLAGIFSTMRDTTDDKDKNKRSSASVKTSQQSEAAEQQLTRAEGEPSNAPLKMTTSSGVVVSGVSPSWMGAAYRDPVRQTVRVKTVEWTNTGEEEAAAAEQEPIAGAATESGAAAAPGSSATGSPETATPGRIVSPGHIVRGSSEQFSTSVGGNPVVGPAAPALEPATDAEVAGVRLGSSIEAVIGVLGRPTFALTGIAGKSYTEKYVFKNADGETVTVLTWNGAVTAVLVS